MPRANPLGSYSYLSGIEPYSSGVIAHPGHEIVHVTLHCPLPYEAGFELIDARLRAEGRPRQALCAVELRSPTPFTREGFIEFNRDYCRLLEGWDLLVDGDNPVARTNVAPRWAAPEVPSLYGFSYTVPSGQAEPTFVVAGAGDLRGGPLLDAEVVRAGETSPEALREKAAHVLRAMTKRLSGLGRAWEDVTVVDVYTVHPIHDLLEALLAPTFGATAIHGIRWHPAQPPIQGLEFEMDVRGVRREVVV